VARPEDGHAFVLTQTERVLPGTGRVHPVLDDAITELDTQAQIVRSVSLTEALMKSMWLPILRE
jgi:hypothetical protein